MKLIYPIETSTYFCTGMILVVLASATYLKVKNGSQSPLAYQLIFFTFMYGVDYLGMFTTNLFAFYPIPSDPSTGLYQPFRAWWVFQFLFVILTIQSWLFGIQYLTCACICSTESPFTLDQLYRLKVYVPIAYSVIAFAMITAMIVTFPGYTYEDSLDRFYSYWGSTARMIIIVTYTFYITFSVASLAMTAYAMMVLRRTVLNINL